MSEAHDPSEPVLTEEEQAQIDLLKRWQALGPEPKNTYANRELLNDIAQSGFANLSLLEALKAGYDGQVTFADGKVVSLPGRE